MTPFDFNQAIFFYQSPAAQEHYTRRAANTIFESNENRSYVDVLILNLNQTSCPPVGEPSQGEISKARHDSPSFSTTNDVDETQSYASTASTDWHPNWVDHPSFGSPPGYIKQTRLSTLKICTVDELLQLAKNTQREFRVFILRQRTSHSRIQITQELFEGLLRGCHVFPKFKEYMVGFGLKYKEQEVGPPPMTFRPLGQANTQGCCGFECSYTLRYPEFTNRNGKQPWSLRQMTAYHRYKKGDTAPYSTWILVGASARAEAILDLYCRNMNRPFPDLNPFEVHIMFLDIAVASWRPYLVDIGNEITNQSEKALLSTIKDDDEVLPVTMGDYQALQVIEEQLIDIILCVDSTTHTTATILAMYEYWNGSNSTTRRTDSNPFDVIILALRQKSDELSYTSRKANALLSKTQSTRNLISNFLERQSAHALKMVQVEAEKETAAMLMIAKRGDRNSASLKVLSIITLIYLPSTIVMGFYSTQFVGQDQSGEETIVVYAQNWWLFFVITIPLTILTLGVWYFWSRYATVFSEWAVSKSRRPDEGLPLKRWCKIRRIQRDSAGQQELV